MNNITYSITENVSGDLISSSSHNSDNEISNWEDIPLTCKKSKKNENIIDAYNYDNDNGERYARELDYDLNYNLKYLTNILEFYGLKKGKLNKKEIIKKILEFEFDTCIENLPIVEERKRLFDNFIELKNDNFFNKFILGGLN